MPHPVRPRAGGACGRPTFPKSLRSGEGADGLAFAGAGTRGRPFPRAALSRRCSPSQTGRSSPGSASEGYLRVAPVPGMEKSPSGTDARRLRRLRASPRGAPKAKGRRRRPRSRCAGRDAVSRFSVREARSSPLYTGSVCGMLAAASARCGRSEQGGAIGISQEATWSAT